MVVEEPKSLAIDAAKGGLIMTAQSKQALMQSLMRGVDMPGMSTTVTAPAVQQAPPPPPPPANGVGNSNGVIVATNLAVPRIQPSSCIVVKNMFDPATETQADFDAEIREDIEEEIANHGCRIKHIYVDKHNAAGVVYIRFVSVEDAVKVAGVFDGRWFAEKRISTEFVIEPTYLTRFPEAR